MAQSFVDQVASTASDTAKALREVAASVKRAGLPGDAGLLEELAAKLSRLALDGLSTTQPIEIAKENYHSRLTHYIEALQELAGDLLMNSKPGSSGVAEASRLLIEVAARHDD